MPQPLQHRACEKFVRVSPPANFRYGYLASDKILLAGVAGKENGEEESRAGDFRRYRGGAGRTYLFRNTQLVGIAAVNYGSCQYF